MKKTTNEGSESAVQARFRELHEGFPGNAPQVLAEVDALIAEAEAVGDRRTQGRALVLKGNSLYIVGKMPEALALCETHEATFRDLELGDVVSGFLNLRAIDCSGQSDYLGAIRFEREALEMLDPAKDPDSRAYLLGNLGLSLRYLGELSAALTVLEESVALWREIEEERRIIPALINLGITCEKAGEMDLAKRYTQEAIEKSRACGDNRRLCLALLNLAGYHADDGRTEEGRNCAFEALALAREMGNPQMLAHALGPVAGSFRESGEESRAREALEEALSIYEAVGMRRGIVVTLLDLAELAESSVEERRRQLERALEIAKEAEIKPEQAKIYLALAEIERSTGNFEQAFDHLRSARRLEREEFDAETQKRLQAVAVRQEIDGLSVALREERKARDEVVTLLETVKTERARAEEASRQKSALLGIAAHDMRSGLAGVMGGLELMKHDLETEASPAQIAENLELARDAAGALLEMLKRLMDHAAIERGELSSQPRLLALDSAIDTAIRDLRPVAKAKRQKIEVNATQGLQLWVDPERLRQILSNLVSNALKYSPAGAPVEIRARLIDGNHRRVRMEVRDRGPGLTEIDQQRLFRPFQTLSARPTAGELSTGLGLHIVARVAESEGGKAGYAPRDGGGSIFWVELPGEPTGQ
jgi:signal transduction histidine kinase